MGAGMSYSLLPSKASYAKARSAPQARPGTATPSAPRSGKTAAGFGELVFLQDPE